MVSVAGQGHGSATTNKVGHRRLTACIQDSAAAANGQSSAPPPVVDPPASYWWSARVGEEGLLDVQTVGVPRSPGSQPTVCVCLTLFNAIPGPRRGGAPG